MRHLNVLRTFAILVLIFLTIMWVACKKQISIESDDNQSLIASAQQLLEDLESSVSKADTSIEALGKRRFNNVAKLADFSNPVYATVNGKPTLTVIITDKKERFKKSGFVGKRALVFSGNATTVTDVKLVEIISKQQSVSEETVNINAGLVSFGDLNKASSTDGQMAFVYNSHYQLNASYEAKGGKWNISKNKLKLKNKVKELQPARSTVAQLSTCNCTTTYLVGYWYDTQTGAIIDIEILDSWQNCPPDAGDGYGDGNPDGYSCEDAAASVEILRDSRLTDMITLKQIPVTTVILNNNNGDGYAQNYHDVNWLAAENVVKPWMRDEAWKILGNTIVNYTFNKLPKLNKLAITYQNSHHQYESEDYGVVWQKDQIPPSYSNSSTQTIGSILVAGTVQVQEKSLMSVNISGCSINPMQYSKETVVSQPRHYKMFQF